ncbi:MAG: ParB/RepB/Spo0J family partition protein [Gammaproteobacteria bacterium]|nr:ParB/RepB/Spo0J family partition protein [Gammaproteobacteria bacterium]
MNVKKRGLGRGLDALLGHAAIAVPAAAVPAVPATAVAEKGERLMKLPVDLLRRGRYQPRSDIRPETLQDLADSIRAQGVVQPIVVRPIGANTYEIIAGERRWRAAQLAGLHEVPVIARDVPDQAAMAMALIENIQREDLNPLEEALALKRLIEEFGLTHQLAAEAVGRSRAAVSNLLRLFELNEDVKQRIERREIDMGHARALLALQGPLQSEAARRVAAKGLSVRETEQLVRRLQAAAAQSPTQQRHAVDPDVRRLQEDLSGKLGASVDIQYNAKGKGRLVVHYNSLDELEGILAHIK